MKGLRKAWASKESQLTDRIANLESINNQLTAKLLLVNTVAVAPSQSSPGAISGMRPQPPPPPPLEAAPLQSQSLQSQHSLHGGSGGLVGARRLSLSSNASSDVTEAEAETIAGGEVGHHGELAELWPELASAWELTQADSLRHGLLQSALHREVRQHTTVAAIGAPSDVISTASTDPNNSNNMSRARWRSAGRRTQLVTRLGQHADQVPPVMAAAATTVTMGAPEVKATYELFRSMELFEGVDVESILQLAVQAKKIEVEGECDDDDDHN